ncbi:LytR/AlgR family response regulator transcription factor [Leptospira sp. GIMC2001]|uniref:LytR/AlgR family response regulator transcription factor n=1 Tax=Leptospira sp. GIMC2001 TaxID=1513297 RepID=UPI00234A50E5|nr:LytTR family DNA-binding domain-containing protein [Leptospira sp. GIMC2001]WCL48936.1 LytTR family DNA-binding domain-containing protein [Leptospira sp. GIMC2001]
MIEKTAYSVLIVEDEYPARELLVKYVLDCPELVLAGVAEDGQIAESLLSHKEYDLIFMDINIPVQSGLDLLKKFHNKNSFFIFATAYSEFAVSAFEYEALDYLLKPFDFSRFRKSVEKAIRFWGDIRNSQDIQSQSLTFTSNSAKCFLPYDEIVYLSSHNKNTVIHAKEKDYEVSKLLKDIEGKLSDEHFYRIHKGYMVNKKYISSIRYDKGGSYLLELRDGEDTVLPVGRAYASNLKGRLGL